MMTNKEIFARNLQSYMDANNKSRKDVCQALGFNYYTFTDWINAKKLPRMDKVQKLADYFGILKSDLIEEKFEVGMTQDEQKNSDAIAVITNKLFSDKDFLSIVEIISKLDKDQRNRAKEILTLAFPEIAE